MAYLAYEPKEPDEGSL